MIDKSVKYLEKSQKESKEWNDKRWVYVAIAFVYAIIAFIKKEK